MDIKIRDLTVTQYVSFGGVDMSLEVKPTVKDYFVGVPPSSVERWDWRDQYKVAKIRHQGSPSVCWAFAAVACLETAYSRHSPDRCLIEFSEQQLVDCVDNGGIMLGHYTRAWWHIIDKDKGIISRSDYPYLGKKESQQEILKLVSLRFYVVFFILQGDKCRSDLFTKIVGPRNYIEISHNDNAIMAAVREYGQVAVCIDHTSIEFQNYKSGIFDVESCENKEIKDLTHAVTIVGYGSDEKDYWIIRNSWGEEWGEGGYMRMVRGKNMCGINLNPYVVYF